MRAVILDTVRYLALVSVALVYGSIFAVIRHYWQRERDHKKWSLSDWSKLLPGHIWRVSLGTIFISTGSVGVTIEHLGDDVFIWYGSPIALTGNVIFLWGMVLLLRYLRARTEHEKRVNGSRRLGDTGAPVEPPLPPLPPPVPPR